MIVYLLHYTQPIAGDDGHFLGVAKSESDIRLDVARHGHGWRRLEPGEAILSDVWECRDATQAARLRVRLARQGGRGRLCSICRPGNAGGMGSGTNRGKVAAARRAIDAGA